MVLNLARLYSDSGNTQQAIAVLNSVPEEDRTAKMEFAVGTSYDQLEDKKNAIDAYTSPVHEPGSGQSGCRAGSGAGAPEWQPA